MRFQKVCKLEDLWQGEMEAFKVGDEDVLLVWPDNGELCAYQGRCPHQEIALIEGRFDGKVLTCRAHLWRFDACSGKGINPKGTQLAKYPIKIEAGEVLIDVEGVQPGFAHS